MTADRLHALIVEDDPAMVAMVRAYLSADPTGPWDVSEAGSVMVAVALIKDRSPDVVLLDLGLPDASGLEVVAQIRDHSAGVALVVLTADQDPETGIATVRAGAQDFLVKGRFPAELIPRSLRYAVERVRMSRELAEREAQYRALFEGSLGFICVHDLEGRILAANPAAAHALGYEPADLAGRSITELLPPSQESFLPAYLSRIQAQDFDTGLLTLVGRTGSERVFEYRNKLLTSATDGTRYVLAFAVDVTEQRQIEERLREEGLRDPLTGCWNRRWLDRAGASPHFGPQWGCILVEVEDIRATDERGGLRASEEVAIGMARFLAARVRVGDEIVALEGGDFVMLLNHAGDDEVDVVVRRLFEAAGVSAPASFTMGFAARAGRETLAETISRADQRLITARKANASAFARRRGRQSQGDA